MKITPKILKFAAGGSSPYSGFTVYEAITAGQPLGESSGGARAKSDSGKELTLKDLFDMIKDIDGLPSEMLSIVKLLLNSFKLANLTGLNLEDMAITYINNLYKIKLAADNKNKFTEAKKEAEKNGAWNELAIAMNGDLVVLDSETGKLATVDLETFRANRDEYKPLTVAQLGYLREWDPRLNMDLEAFNIISNSMGYKGFLALLKEAVGSLGSSTLSRKGYFTNEGLASKGLEVLQSLSPEDLKALITSGGTVEGLFEYDIISKDLYNQIKALTSYLSLVMPENAKTWAAVKLGSTNPQVAIESLILQSLLPGNTESHSFKVNYKGSMDKVTGAGKGSSKLEEKATFLTSLLMGYGNETEKRTLIPGGLAAFTVEGTAYGSFIDTGGNTVSDLTLQELLTKTGIAGITNSSSIMFGDTILTPNLLSSIAVENNGGFYAILPCRKENGVIVPNFDLMDAYEKVILDVNSKTTSSTTYEDRVAMIELEVAQIPELRELLDMSGRLDFNKVSPFFIVDGIASDIAINFGDMSEKSLMALTDDLNDLNYYLKVTGLEKEFKDSIWNDIIPWADNTKVYKSNIFIPIKTNNRLAAIISSGLQIPESKALLLEGEYQLARLKGDMRSNDPRLLFAQ